jgi:hypothetical protein
MLKELNTAYSNLEMHFRELITELAELNHADFNHSPAPGKWSCGQILEHLYLSFTGTNLYLQKKLQYPESFGQNRLMAFLRSKTLTFFLNSNIKLKAPKRLEATQEVVDFRETTEKLNEQIRILKSILEGFPPSLRYKNVFRHPIVGLITIGQTVHFMDEHLIHHSKQINGIIKNLHLSYLPG